MGSRSYRTVVKWGQDMGVKRTYQCEDGKRQGRHRRKEARLVRAEMNSDNMRSRSPISA